MREISKEMLSEIEWIHRQLKVMGNGFDKKLTADYIGRSIEFIYGALWERQRQENMRQDQSIAGSLTYSTLPKTMK